MSADSDFFAIKLLAERSLILLGEISEPCSAHENLQRILEIASAQCAATDAADNAAINAAREKLDAVMDSDDKRSDYHERVDD